MNYDAIRARLEEKKHVFVVALNYVTDLRDGDQTIELLERAAVNGDKAAEQVLIEISKE